MMLVRPMSVMSRYHQMMSYLDERCSSRCDKKGPKRFILGARISWYFTKNGFVRLLEQLREFIRFGQLRVVRKFVSGFNRNSVGELTPHYFRVWGFGGGLRAHVCLVAGSQSSESMGGAVTLRGLPTGNGYMTFTGTGFSVLWGRGRIDFGR